LNDIQSQSRGRRAIAAATGEEHLRARIGQLAQAAANRRRMEALSRAMLQGADFRQLRSPWFALLVPRAMPSDAGAGCPGYYARLESTAKQFRT
jgi:hypothetical protein